MSKLYVGDSNSTSKKPKKSYVGYNGKAVQIMYSEPKVYGVAWDGSAATSFARLEDAKNFSAPNPYYAGMSGTPSSPFDDLYPWCEMKKSENADAGTVVAIPKFWYKLEYASGTTGLKVFIADKPVTGFKVSPAHMDRGDGAGERDVVYVGRYHCASDYKSKTGVAPTKTNISTSRAGIHNLGSKIWQYDYPTHITIQMLYLVEFANWDSQTMIGYGGDENKNNGLSDSMPYHTGTMQSARTTYGAGVQYRNIENLWANEFYWIDGIRYNYTSVYSIINPAEFSDSTGGVLVTTRPTSSGYISGYSIPSVNGYDWFMYPSALNGSDSTYVCDYEWSTSNSNNPLHGGGSCNNVTYGLFFTNSGWSFNNNAHITGSRLMVLP